MPSTTAGTAPPRRSARAVLRVREEMLRLVHPAEARISPDGATVAVAAFAPDGAHLVLAPTGRGGPAPAPVPATGADRHSPRWLPDSRTLVHLAEGGAGAPTTIDLLDTRTGAVRTLAEAPGAVEDLLVADDGTEALVLCAEDGAERDGMHLGLPVRLGAAPDPERFTPGTGRRCLHLLDLRTGRLRPVGPAGLTVWNLAWRGGDLAVATVSEDTLPAGYYEATFAALDLADGTARTLYRPEGQLGAPALSPDRGLAAVVEGISIVAGRPVLVDTRSGAARPVPGVEDATWLDLADDAHLRFAGWDGTGSRTGHTEAASAPREEDRSEGTDPATGHRARTDWRAEATLGGPGFQPFLSLSADGELATSVLDAPGRPAEAVLAATHGPDAWNWRPLTRLNPPTPAYDQEGLPALAAVRTRPTSWTASDGTPVHGLLLDTPPAEGAVPAGPRPLSVLVHGGPAWLWSSSYAPGDVLGLGPALAAAGHLVLLPNPRGSSGYGLGHARAVVGDVGGGDLDDVLSAVRHLADAGEADAERVAVLGHSYGGYLAAVAAARTGHFRAAVVVSAPTDWLSFTHTSNIGGGYDRTYRIGTGAAALHARSAVAADGGPGTPTLVLHGAEDRVTPPAQGHGLYRSLLRSGNAAAELYVYPGEGHEFTDPGRLLHAARTVEDWLHTHLGTPPRATGPNAAPGRNIPRTAPDAAPAVPGGELPRTPPGTDLPAARPPRAAPGHSTAAAPPETAVPEGGIPRTPPGTAHRPAPTPPSRRTATTDRPGPREEER